MSATPKPVLPEPEPACPGCGDRPPEIEAMSVHEGDHGGVTGDLVCVECGHTIDTNVLLREPDAPTIR